MTEPTADGSSPLTRGKLARAERRRGGERLIPAHAGKTTTPGERPASSRAHPRSRGENVRPDRHSRAARGSSPLTRGKLERFKPGTQRGRLIPAHAGKTSQARRTSWLTWAHPRSRGENDETPLDMDENTGSSPLTRGKHFLTCAFIAQIGQILESLELCASSESYSSPEAYATDALQGRVRSIDLGLRSSRGAS